MIASDFWFFLFIYYHAPLEPCKMPPSFFIFIFIFFWGATGGRAKRHVELEKSMTSWNCIFENNIIYLTEAHVFSRLLKTKGDKMNI